MSAHAADILKEKLRVLADANLVAVRVSGDGGVVVSSHLQKAILFVLLAYEGETLSIAGVAARGCCSKFAATYALTALTQEGLVIAERIGLMGQRRFTVSIRRLLEIQTAEPLVALGGRGPDTKRREQYRRSYHRCKKLKAHLAGDAPAPPAEKAIFPTEAVDELYLAMQALQIMPESFGVVRGGERSSMAVNLRARIVVHMRDVRNLSWPKIASAVRGDPGKHATCIGLYRRFKARETRHG